MVYRRTLAFLEQQRAEWRGAASAEIAKQIAETRGEIHRIVQRLRAYGYAPEDDEGADEATGARESAATTEMTPLLAYARALLDRLHALRLPALGSHPTLTFADLYVERNLAQLASDDEPGGGSTATLIDLVAAPGARVVLAGDPGMGKSTSLRVLALACAAQIARAPLRLPETLTHYRELSFVPLLLAAGDLAAAYDPAAPEDADGERLLERYLRRYGRAGDLPALQQALQSGAALVLVDGADDLSAPAGAALDALGRLIARYPANRYVVARAGSDERAHSRLAGFAHYGLAPLDHAQQTALIDRCYAALAGSGLSLGLEESHARAAQLHSAVVSDDWLRDMARRPLGLVLLVAMHSEGHALPEQVRAAARRLCDLLARGWDQDEASDPALESAAGDAPAADRRLAALEPFAAALLAVAHGGAEPALDDHQALALLDPAGAAAAGSDPLGWYRRHGFLARRGAAAHAIPWLWLREYLAARALAARPDFATYALGLRHEPGWRRPLLVALREVADSRDPRPARDCVGLLLQSAADRAPQARVDLLLAAEGLIGLGDRGDFDPGARADVRDRLLKLIGQHAATVAERVRAGTLLGQLGDPRFERMSPPLALIPAGPCLIGDGGGFEDEGPMHRVTLPTFQIGIYPVTNREFALFLDEIGHPKPRYWSDPRFNNPSHPVVGVTWHDAVAYCRWLTARLAAAGQLEPGQVVRLPTEFEWEKAASWDHRREIKLRYPWGYDWDCARANTADGRGAWVTAPVGCYPGGVSPYGLHDCLGNVWEWTANSYGSYPGTSRPYHEPGSYVLRGSSCVLEPTNVRCTYRSRLPASYWRYHLGFRVVVARPLPEEA